MRLTFEKAKEQGYLLFGTEQERRKFLFWTIDNDYPYIYVQKKGKNVTVVMDLIGIDYRLSDWAVAQVVLLKLKASSRADLTGFPDSCYNGITCERVEEAETVCRLLRAIFWRDRGKEEDPAICGLCGSNPVLDRLAKAMTDRMVILPSRRDAYFRFFWQDWCRLHQWPAVFVEVFRPGLAKPVIQLPRSTPWTIGQRSALTRIAQEIEIRDQPLKYPKTFLFLEENKVSFQGKNIPEEYAVFFAQGAVQMLRRSGHFAPITQPWWQYKREAELVK
jgi:hypothetical protein